jgi:hypothetical protein
VSLQKNKDYKLKFIEYEGSIQRDDYMEENEGNDFRYTAVS